ncbi:DUF4367 domain-containing protein [Clostridium tagluense]|uniref:DUF4367 domain-containing protein n=1 Tax=Clostridium tagluense TaxID=360422 RepID=A0A401USL0_9CLOT|nr:DUF4367 domain-containing protein [Clostridium tagluense]GCD12540.1 hypothetical protein Ctaglu_41630 [Clostridium tagluense]
MNKKSDMNELKQLEDLLINVDVNSSEHEATILNRLKYKIETGTIKSNYIEKDGLYMKKKFFRPATIAGLALATFISGASAAYASGTLDSIIAHFQVGHTQITQYASNNEAKDVNTESDAKSLKFMQEGYKGKLFDKNGKEAIYGESKTYYTADGKIITEMGVKDLPNGEHEFVISTEENTSSNEKSLTLEEVKKVANSNSKLPNYLPQGYAFKNATTSFKGAGVNVVYGNSLGDTITLLASSTKEATCGVASTGKVSETSIDGKKVTLSTNCAFWESKGVTYQLYWNFKNSSEDKTPSMDMKEVSKIIESMK